MLWWTLLWGVASALLLDGAFSEAALAAAPLLGPFEVRRLEAFQPNALTGDQFGAAVAVSADGSTLVVGAPLADRDPDAGDGIDLGQVYVYRRSVVGLSWEIAARLDSPDATPGRRLGHAVAVSADGITVAVGAPGAAAGSGAVYFYAEPIGGWAGQRSPDQTLLAADGAPGADFGWSVALDGALLVAGAPSATVSSQVGAGAGYLFEDTGGGFAQVAKLSSATPQAMALLGSAVAAGGGWVALGEPARDAGPAVDAGGVALYAQPGGGWSNAVPTQQLVGTAAAELGRGLATDGTQLVAGLPGASASTGQARVYLRQGSVWTLAATLGPGAGSATGDRLGTSVSLAGAKAVLGAPGFGAGNEGAAFLFEQPPGGWAGTLVPGARLEAGEAGAELGGAVSLSASWLVTGSVKSDVAALDAGAVDAFRAPAGAWVSQGIEDARVAAFGFDASALGAFGAAVAIDENTLVVGHPGDDHVGSDEGSASVFLRSQAGDSWEIAARLVASPANPYGGDERFGASVAVDGDVIVVGAPYYDLFGPSSDEGVAFVFVKPPGGWSGTLTPDARLEVTNPNPFNANEHVGISVAIEGDLIAVGADSYELFHAASGEGAVFVYERPPGGWTGTLTQNARLTASL
ncbi:MAG: FG-GAP repeat protein, partial [Thermoleophilia bacterium]|nr:FG-GAP repeat protein [Thermoleophilia bacterium]